MSTLPEWVKALNISTETAQEWLKIVNDPKELLLWAIENRAIDEAQYLEWAKNHYGLALIKPEFFKTPAPLQIWKKYVMGPWRMDLIPISEWNGTLFVACLEPQQINMGGLKTQYLLSSLKPLKAWWEVYQNLNKGEYTVMAQVVAKQPQQVKIEETPQVSSPPTPPQELKAPATAPSPAQALEQNLEPHNAAANAPEPSIPLTGNIEDLMQSATQKKKEEEENIANQNLQMPDGLNLSMESAFSGSKGPIGLKLESSPVVEEETKTSKKNLEDLKLTPPLSTPPQNSVSADKNQVTPQAPVPPIAPATATTQAAPVAPAASIPSKPVIPAITPAATKPVPPPPPAKAQWPIGSTSPNEKSRTSSAADPYVNQLFQDMKGHYEQCIIFKLQGENELAPWHWDISLPIDATLSPIIDLTQASIFKIVVDTKMPYHGYVCSSASNDLFFRRWNQGNYPEHISVFPMISDRGFHGVVVGMTTKEKGLDVSLTHYQNSVDRMVSGLIQTQKLAA